MKLSEYINKDFTIGRVKKIELSENIVHKTPALKKESATEKYSLDNAVLIGVTGSYGKSSAAYLLHKYLQFRGYRSVCSSSISMDIPTSYAVPNVAVEGIVDDENEINVLLVQAEAYEADFIILEVNEAAIANGVFDSLPFDCKVLTSFKSDHNKHMNEEEYFNLKNSFLSNNKTLTVMNSESDRLEDFIQNVGEDLIKLFGVGYAGLTDYSSELETLKTKTTLENSVYPLLKLGSVDNSYLRYSLNGVEKELYTTLSLDGNLSNILTVIAVLDSIGEFDEDSFSEFVKDFVNIPGRAEDLRIRNKVFLFDTAGEEFNSRVINELDSLDAAKAAYKKLKKKNFETLEISNIIAIYNIIGGVTEENLETLESDKSFKFINPMKGTTEDETLLKRARVLFLGAQFYNLTHKLAAVPTDIDFYERLMNKIHLFVDDSDFTNFKNSKKFSQSELDAMYKKLEDAYISQYPNSDVKYAWRNADAVKCFFSDNIDIWNSVSEYFRSLKNEKLIEACDFLDGVIEFTNEKFADTVRKYTNSKISKYYITMSNYSIGLTYDIEKIKKCFDTNIETETFADRRDALKKIYNDSKDGDLVLISGRGNQNLYARSDGGFDSFTDIDYIKNLLKGEN